MTSSDHSGSTALVTGASPTRLSSTPVRLHSCARCSTTPGRRSAVVVMSSGAAVAGSPLSGGYAGAKATIRLITGYAADESARAGLGIRFLSLLPRLTSATELGSMAVTASARRDGVDVDDDVARIGPALTPEEVGKATLDLVTSGEYVPGAYLLTPAGLTSAA
jgi:NAD(P)-dependent dehydrogenase (short-subunit alcohol dehydrogenase family)